MDHSAPGAVLSDVYLRAKYDEAKYYDVEALAVPVRGRVRVILIVMRSECMRCYDARLGLGSSTSRLTA